MTLLLKVLSPYATATEHSSAIGTKDNYSAVAPAERESNSTPRILIGHVDDDGGELPFFPLLVGLMGGLTGGLIVLMLLLLACRLLLRMAEGGYLRLPLDDPGIGHRTKQPAKPPRVSTYFSYSCDVCVYADHDEEANQALPAIRCQFQDSRKG